MESAWLWISNHCYQKWSKRISIFRIKVKTGFLRMFWSCLLYLTIPLKQFIWSLTPTEFRPVNHVNTNSTLFGFKLRIYHVRFDRNIKTIYWRPCSEELESQIGMFSCIVWKIKWNIKVVFFCFIFLSFFIKLDWLLCLGESKMPFCRFWCGRKNVRN